MKDVTEGKLYWLDDPSKIMVVEGFNIRQDLDIKPLKNSIQKYGVRQPLVCERSDDPKTPFLVKDGHRRLAALKDLAGNGGCPRFPVILDEDFDTEVDADVEQAISVMQRKALNPMEESDLFQRLLESEDSGCKTQSDVAKVVGVTAQSVGQRLKLQGLSTKAQKAVRSGKLPFDYALDLARKDTDHKAQNRRLEKTLAQLQKRAEAKAATEAAAEKGGKAGKAAKKAAAKKGKDARKSAKAASSGAIPRPSKKELLNLANMYELRFGSEFPDTVEVLAAALRYSAAEISEEDLFDTMNQFFDSGEGYSDVLESYEAEREAEKEAEREARKAEREAAKAAAAPKKSKAKKSSGKKPPAKPGKPKAKSKKSKAKKKSKK